MVEIFFAAFAAKLRIAIEISSTFALGLDKHLIYMDRCVELALLAQGFVAPNPMVGCVVVLNNKIVAEGYHHAYGQAHAEIDALSKVNQATDLSPATLYVNLEPCNHWGKTGPCSHEIVKRGIKKVVIGMLDPNEQVNGEGINYLKSQGVEVLVLNHEPSRAVNRRFVWFMKHKMPYIILKWAESADGFIGKQGVRTQISAWDAQVLLHRWRSQEMAVAVGKNTFLVDKPQLTVRLHGGKNPARLIWWGEKDKSPEILGYDFIRSNDLEQTTQNLAMQGIASILVEGGPTLLQSFINNNMYNEIRVLRSKQMKLKGGVQAPISPLPLKKVMDLSQDEVWEAVV